MLTPKSNLNTKPNIFSEVVDVQGLLLASLGKIVLRAASKDNRSRTASDYNSMDIGRLFWSYIHTTGVLHQTHVLKPLSQNELSCFLRGQHGGARGFAKDFGADLCKAETWNELLEQLRIVSKPATRCPVDNQLVHVVTWPFLAVALCEHRQCIQRFPFFQT